MKISKKSVCEKFRKKLFGLVVWCPAIALSLGTAGCSSKSDHELIRPAAGGSIRATGPSITSKSDHELVQDNWIEFTPDSSITERWVFAADIVWSEGARDGQSYRVTTGKDKAQYKLDPSKNPKTIDITALEGSGRGRTVMGIYAIEGDTLTLCIPCDKPGRPTGFADKDGMLYVLKREKR